jgi:hypothetical protein
MKYLKLMWLIMSGRLIIEPRNRPVRPERDVQLNPAGTAGRIYSRITH